MELEFKPDFERARARWARFWRGACTDRPPVKIVLPKPGREVPRAPQAYGLPYGDVDRAADQTLAWAAAQEWLGDAIPGYIVTFAPDHFALLLGAEMLYDDGFLSGTPTSWILPCLDDYNAGIRFRPEGQWWQKTVDCIRAFRRHCDGRLIVSGTNLQGGLDALAAIRDPQRLLMDLLDCPQDVHQALAQIDRALADVRAALARELDLATWGSVTRHGTYASGLVDVPQCDFSAMLSPAMFREFEIPSLIKECGAAQGNLYHLDGKEALPHLPALAEVPNLHAIQWQPGASGADKDWSAVFRQIDDLGLGQMRAGTREQVRALWRDLRQRHRLYINGVWDIRTRAEAEAFLEDWEQAPGGAGP